jgi:hypothetical protein
MNMIEVFPVIHSMGAADPALIEARFYLYANAGPIQVDYYLDAPVSTAANIYCSPFIFRAVTRAAVLDAFVAILDWNLDAIDPAE